MTASPAIVRSPREAPCVEPHQGCGCALDASHGAHPGPCDYDGGYWEGGATVLCTLCLDAIRESKRAAWRITPDAAGTWLSCTYEWAAGGLLIIRAPAATARRAMDALAGVL